MERKIIEYFADFNTKQFYTDIAIKKDQIFREALAQRGLDPDDIAFIKGHISIIRCGHDKFEHIYYNYQQFDQVRILSWEYDPPTRIVYDADRHVTKIVHDFQYY